MTSSAGAEPLLSVREVARRLGISRASVYKLCARGELEHVRLLNVIRISSDVLGRLRELAPTD